MGLDTGFLPPLQSAKNREFFPLVQQFSHDTFSSQAPASIAVQIFQFSSKIHLQFAQFLIS